MKKCHLKDLGKKGLKTEVKSRTVLATSTVRHTEVFHSVKC